MISVISNATVNSIANSIGYAGQSTGMNNAAGMNAPPSGQPPISSQQAASHGHSTQPHNNNRIQRPTTATGLPRFSGLQQVAIQPPPRSQQRRVPTMILIRPSPAGQSEYHQEGLGAAVLQVPYQFGMRGWDVVSLLLGPTLLQVCEL